MRNNKGQFAKGNTGKPKGAKAKTTRVLKDTLKELVLGQTEKIDKELTKLEGREYLEIIVKILPYLIPKSEPKDLEDSEDSDKVTGLTIQFVDYSKEGNIKDTDKET